MYFFKLFSLVLWQYPLEPRDVFLDHSLFLLLEAQKRRLLKRILKAGRHSSETYRSKEVGRQDGIDFDNGEQRETKREKEGDIKRNLGA